MPPRTYDLTDGHCNIEVIIDGYYAGQVGPIGPTGDTGDTGVTGLPGDIGPTGDMGEVGPTGPTGATGSGGSYTNLNPTPQTLGGIPSGSTFEDKSFQDMFDALLYPYQYPSFSSFSILGQETTLEVGDSVLANPTFTWSVSNQSNVKPDTTIIRNESIIIANNISNVSPYSAIDGAVTKLSAASNNWSIQQENTQDQIFSRNFGVNWRWRVYNGESLNSTLDETQVKGLTNSQLRAAFNGTYNFVAGGYKYLAYPSLMGLATQFKDTATNLDVPMEAHFVVSITNSFGVTTNYNVHRTTFIVGSVLQISVS